MVQLRERGIVERGWGNVLVSTRTVNFGASQQRGAERGRWGREREQKRFQSGGEGRLQFLRETEF